MNRPQLQVFTGNPHLMTPAMDSIAARGSGLNAPCTAPAQIGRK